MKNGGREPRSYMNKFHRTTWNYFIKRINYLSANPWGICDPLAPLPLVGNKHKWSVADVISVQNRLKQICSENVFVEPVIKWSREILNEINIAIDRGWCGCCSPFQECVATSMGVSQIIKSVYTQNTSCSTWIKFPGYWYGSYWVPERWEETVHSLEIKTNYTDVDATINNIQLYEDTSPVYPGWQWRWQYFQVLSEWTRPICGFEYLAEEYMIYSGPIFKGKCSTYKYDSHYCHRPTEYMIDSGAWLIRPHYYELRGWCQKL